MKKVLVITGSGGIGLAVARRLGTGYKVVLADFAPDKLAAAANDLTAAGYDVATVALDVADKESVENLARTASEFGPLHALVHTAALSPTQAETERLLTVNLVGTARVIEAFEPYLGVGTVGIIVSSFAGHWGAGLFGTLRQQLATTKADGLLALASGVELKDTTQAYALSKYGNLVQVQAAALPWGAKGARIVSVSPGVISTPMWMQQKAQAPESDVTAHSPAQRIGTPEDVASVVDFLQSPAAGFITGTDILVDGGVMALVAANPPARPPA